MISETARPATPVEPIVRRDLCVVQAQPCGKQLLLEYVDQLSPQPCVHFGDVTFGIGNVSAPKDV